MAATEGASASARWMLCLATGAPIPDEAAPAWDAVLRMSVAERCASLAWLRSGEVIRARAPADAVGRWRSVAVDADARSRRQLQALLGVLRALEGAGIDAVVLKGAPLSQRLYGNAHVRATADADLWVPLAQRTRAREVLARDGWVHADGHPPWEESLTRPDRDRQLYLDVHSSLLDHTLAHLPAPPPASERAVVDGHDLRAHTGPLVAAFLASHMAKHRLAPLLWLLDLGALWAALEEPARGGAVRDAERAGLGKYLSWGLARTRLVAPAAAGDTAALRALGFEGASRRDAHPVYRDARLAPDVPSAVRVIGAWMWPRPLRRDPAAFARRCLARVGASVTRPGMGRQSYGQR